MEVGTIMENGYKIRTTFWDDFSIAEKFGKNAIKDTYKRAFSSWKDNIEYLTELSLILNWKGWYYRDKNEDFCRLYAELWDECDIWCNKNLKGEEARYYYEQTN